ncbi:MAG: YihY/virulence factor BrkB family protein [Bdellovibrionota bacterium]
MPRQLKKFLAAFLDNFAKHDLMTLAAALAFYTALSLAPLLLITLALLELIGPETQNRLVEQIQSVVGSNAAGAVNVVIEGAKDRPDLSGLGGAIGFVALFFSASGVFAQIQSSLNLIWEAKAPQSSGFKTWIRRRLLSMGMVLSLGFVSMVSLIVTAGLSFVFKESSTIWDLLNHLVSFGVFMALFAAIFKVLPDVPMRWREAFVGGAITGALFVIGKQLIGLYLGQSAVASAYGAMGSLLVFLVWVYYSALTLFIGAELTAMLAFRRPESTTDAKPDEKIETQPAR